MLAKLMSIRAERQILNKCISDYVPRAIASLSTCQQEIRSQTFTRCSDPLLHSKQGTST